MIPMFRNRCVLKKKVMKVIRKEDDIRNIFANTSISEPLPLGDKIMFTADEDEILIRLTAQYTGSIKWGNLVLPKLI